VGDERAETYLRVLAQAELRRVGEQIRRVDAMGGIEARSREGMSLFGATERAQWKVIRTARILVAAGVLDQECLDDVTSVLSAAIQVRSRLMLNWRRPVPQSCSLRWPLSCRTSTGRGSAWPG
jgi:hypothetical protein